MTAKKKLTKTVVDALMKPEAGQELHYDSDLTGFGIRVTAGSKTYFAESRVNGKTVRVKLGKHGELTPDEARKKARQELGLMAGGINPNKAKAAKRAKGVTLGEAFEEYCGSKDLRPKTIQVYQGAMRRCFSDWLKKPIIDITQSMVARRHAEISKSNGPRSNEDGSKAQANQAMRVLRSTLNYASFEYKDEAGRSVLPENPVVILSNQGKWNRNKRRQSTITKTQLPTWFRTVVDLQYASDETGQKLLDKSGYFIPSKSGTIASDYLLLCLFTGLRRTEAACLKWSDINLADKTLTIPPDNSKNHEEHRLPLSTFVADILERRKVAATSAYVFPGSGERGHLIEIKRPIKKVINRSGVKFMMHDLRRTFITIAESLDISHYSIKKLANHKTSADVTSGYIAVDVERLREPMQRITDYILECVSLPVHAELAITKELTKA